MNRLRDVLIVSSAAALVAGCSGHSSSQINESPNATKAYSTVSRVKSDLRFVAKGSTNYSAINCAVNSSDKQGRTLTNPVTPDKIDEAYTLGVTVDGTNARRNAQTNRFLGGISIISLGHDTYQAVVSGDPAGQAADIRLVKGGDTIARNQTVRDNSGHTFHFQVELGWPLRNEDGSDGSPQASITCIPLAPDQAPAPSGTSTTV